MRKSSIRHSPPARERIASRFVEHAHDLVPGFDRDTRHARPAQDLALVLAGLPVEQRGTGHGDHRGFNPIGRQQLEGDDGAAAEDELRLPSGEYDVPLLLQDRTASPENRPVLQGDSSSLGLAEVLDYPTVEFLGNTGAVALPTAASARPPENPPAHLTPLGPQHPRPGMPDTYPFGV